MDCSCRTLTHKHHIIPRYKGGTDDPENLVEVTVTQHTMYHYCNYQLWGNVEDYVAWRGLSGQISTADFLYEKSKIANLPENREKQKKKFKEIKHQQGEKNSQYGKMWITNGTKKGTYRINKNEAIPEGFRKGRICFDENDLDRIYVITAPTNEVIKTKYLMNFCVEHNLTHRVMLRAAKKRGKSHKGYTVYFDDV
jgi:hypothetical protein